MSDKRGAPASAIDIALAKKDSNVARAVPISGTGNQILVKDSGQVVIRKVGRTGANITSGRAKALKACKGKKGCDFATCVEKAFGKMPSNLKYIKGVECVVK